jgi:hypothetical protein
MDGVTDEMTSSPAQMASLVSPERMAVDEIVGLVAWKILPVRSRRTTAAWMPGPVSALTRVLAEMRVPMRSMDRTARSRREAVSRTIPAAAQMTPPV